MKSSRPSVLHEVIAPSQFHSQEPDNLLRVEQPSEGGVVIYAAKANFNSAQRRAFVVYLKAEGFISEGVQLAAGDHKVGATPMDSHILWVFDPCWPHAEVRFNLYSRRLCARLLFGPVLVWLFFMWFVAFPSLRQAHRAPAVTVSRHQ